MSDRQQHWQQVYDSRDVSEVSWFQDEPSVSLRLVESVADPSCTVVDVGGGASLLVDALVVRGFTDLTVVDVSQRALDIVRARLDSHGIRVTMVESDIVEWDPSRTFDVWHDRAAFHFLTDNDSRARYVDLVARSVVPGGSLIVATFATDGPTHCSGLEVARYSAAELTAQFAAHFTLVADEREEHCTPSGALQMFTWVVLRRDSHGPTRPAGKVRLARATPPRGGGLDVPPAELLGCLVRVA